MDLLDLNNFLPNCAIQVAILHLYAAVVIDNDRNVST